MSEFVKEFEFPRCTPKADMILENVDFTAKVLFTSGISYDYWLYSEHGEPIGNRVGIISEHDKDFFIMSEKVFKENFKSAPGIAYMHRKKFNKITGEKEPLYNGAEGANMLLGPRPFRLHTCKVQGYSDMQAVKADGTSVATYFPGTEYAYYTYWFNGTSDPIIVLDLLNSNLGFAVFSKDEFFKRFDISAGMREYSNSTLQLITNHYGPLYVNAENGQHFEIC